MGSGKPRAPRACPDCGGRLVPIVYGLPDGELSASAAAGEVLLGGCLVFGDELDPTHGCVRCGEQFQRRGRFLRPHSRRPLLDLA